MDAYDTAVVLVGMAIACESRLAILRAIEIGARTVASIARATDLSRTAVYFHLRVLERGGLLRRDEDRLVRVPGPWDVLLKRPDRYGAAR